MISKNQIFLLSFVIGGVTGFICFCWSFNISWLSSMKQNDPSLQGNYKKELKIELIIEGLSSPTSMAFVDDNKIWVWKKILG